MAFSFYRQIDIPSDGTERTNYPVKVTLNAANFGSTDDTDSFPEMLASGIDVAFYSTAVETGTPLNYWRESFDADDEVAEFWVLIPTLPDAGGLSIFMFYGDSGASDTSDGTSVFPLFFQGEADLEATTIDLMTSCGLGNSSPIIEVTTEGSTREASNVLYDTVDADSGRRYKLWYGGSDNHLRMAYAATPEGPWTKYNSAASVLNDAEDAYVLIMDDDSYLLVCEDRDMGDQENLKYATSSDGLSWTDQGAITLRDSGGTPKSPHNAQSPTIWREGATYYMLYENYPNTPQNVRLASSSDGIDWQDVQAGAVMDTDVDNWINADQAAGTALVPDDVRKIDSTYYMTYHIATDNRGSGLATSTDRVNWTGVGELHIDDITRLIAGTIMFVPDEDNDVTVAPVGVIATGQTSMDPDVFQTGIVYKDMCRDTQTLPAEWTSGTGGSGSSSVDFRNGFLRLNPAQDVAAAAWLRSDDVTFTNNFEVACRKWCRSPKFHSLAFGAGAVAPPASTSNHHASQPASGYAARTAQGTGYTNANTFIVESSAADAQSVVNPGGGGAFDQSMFWQIQRFSYLSDGSLETSFDGTTRGSGSDSTFLSNEKDIVVAQGEQGVDDYNNGGTQYIDWVYARPFFDTDPTVTVGDQSNPVASTIALTDEAVRQLETSQSAENTAALTQEAQVARELDREATSEISATQSSVREMEFTRAAEDSFVFLHSADVLRELLREAENTISATQEADGQKGLEHDASNSIAAAHEATRTVEVDRTAESTLSLTQEADGAIGLDEDADSTIAAVQVAAREMVFARLASNILGITQAASQEGAPPGPQPAIPSIAFRESRETRDKYRIDGLLVPCGFQVVTGLSSVKRLSPPQGARIAILSPTGAGVRWRDDGTDPSTTVGMLLVAGDTLVYTGDLVALSLIEITTTAQLNVSYYF